MQTMYSYLEFSSQNTASYAVQYANAFETLFKQRQGLLGNTTKTSDLPMLFLLRHYLEISLKNNIEYFRKFSELSDKLNLNVEHNLMELNNIFIMHILNTSTLWNIDTNLMTQINRYIYNLEKLINLISKVDPKSFSFRYSHSNKNNNKNIPVGLILDLYTIGKLYKDSKDILDYSIDIFQDIRIRQNTTG